MSEAWGCMCVRVIMASAAGEDWAGFVSLGFSVSRGSLAYVCVTPGLTSVSGNLITNGQS